MPETLCRCSVRAASPSANLVVAARLQRPIIGHLLRNTANRPGPLVLCAHGEPGNGKTTGVHGTLRALDTAVFTADATMFESVEAGEPPRLLKKLYSQAAVVRSPGAGREPRPAALVLDDAHLFLGRYAGTQYTVNSQHLQGLLQGLCDDPSLAFGRAMPRVPVYLTCNDLDALPLSLRRPGRTTLLHWSLTLEERVNVLCRLFPIIDRDDLEYLVLEFVAEPLAFFADLRRIWNERQTRFDARTLNHALKQALAGKWEASAKPPIAAELFTLARELVASRGPEPETEEQP